MVINKQRELEAEIQHLNNMLGAMHQIKDALVEERDKANEELRIAREAMSIGTRLWEGNLAAARAERNAATTALRNLVAAAERDEEYCINHWRKVLQGLAGLDRMGMLRVGSILKDMREDRKLPAAVAAAKEVLK